MHNKNTITSIICVSSQAGAVSSFTSRSTRFVVHGEVKLVMISTVVWDIFLGVETLSLGALLSAVSALVNVAFR